MLIGENFFLALNSIRANLSRAFLTMLGIIIGIASVIAIMTVGNSLNQSVASQMQGMGASDVTIMLQQKSEEEQENDYGMFFTEGPTTESVRDSDYITEEMISDVKERYADKIAGVSLTNSLGSGQATIGKQYANVSVSGVNEDAYSGEDLTILAGREFLPIDYEEGKLVTIVSDRYIENLYDGDMAAAIGHEAKITIGSSLYTFTIIGVYEYETDGMMISMASDQDTLTSMYLPFLAVKNQLHDNRGYSYFTLQTAADVDIPSFMDEIETYMNAVYYYSNDSYEISTMSMESLLSTMTDMLGNIQLAISIIAGISLLVGGIGVMNIMLVSITERTREIGTRKALGAKNSSIRFQFIMESVVLCSIGGIIGIVLGVALGSFGASLLDFPASASTSSILIAFGFSAAIGVFFGFYPANRAAQMNPIDALRYE